MSREGLGRKEGRIGSEGGEWRRLDRKEMSFEGLDGKELSWEGLGRRGMS